MITLGRLTDPSEHGRPLQIVCDDPALRRHTGEPWFREYLRTHLGIEPEAQIDTRTVADADESSLSRHTFVCGSTGCGKSKLIEHLVVEQIRQGCSAVVLDPKAETVDHLLGHLAEIGLSPEQVILLDPRVETGIPGWNPLNSGIPIAQAAADFVSVLERSTTSWGPRMQDLLTNALLVTGAHGASIYELVRLLTRDEYRTALLRRAICEPPPAGYDEARSYFLEEFGAWSRSERAQAVGPVLNKLRELLRSAYLRPLLCARRNTLMLSQLWDRQRVVLVHLDRTGLGEEGAKLLGGLLSNLLFRTAMRATGRVPVVLAVDELATVEHFVGAALIEIVTVARSKHLRLLVACQHLAQLSEGLRSALLANPAVRVFFRLGPQDVRLVAQSLAVGAEPRVIRLSAKAERFDRQSGDVPHVEWRHAVHDAYGNRLRLSVRGWEDLSRTDGYRSDPVGILRRFASSERAGRLYIRAADDGRPVEIGRYVARLTPADCRIEGPSPLELVIRFPKPLFSAVEKATEADRVREWTKSLQDLPVQHAVVKIAGSRPGTIKVVNVTDPLRDQTLRAYTDDVLRSGGQSAAEVVEAMRWRKQQVERIATGHVDPERTADEGTVDDGSFD